MARTVRRLTALPPTSRLYGKAALAAGRHGTTLPEVELVVDRVTVDRDRLAAYDRACGFSLRDELPPTYPQVLAFPVQLALMTDDQFPFALPGLLHIRNAISVRRPVDAGERLTLRVHAERLEPHPKGAQLDVVTDAEVDGEAVWTGRATYLARGANLRPAGISDLAVVRPEPELPEPTTACWRVPAGTGRRYASVAGDLNPIHLHPLAAKAFGFRRAIAHGMWSKARCLAALEGRLPEAYDLDVAFKKPLLLPATVEFASEVTAGGWVFGLRSPDGTPHLAGTAEAEEEPG
ncbi:MAG: MaoC family dehydratase [Streptosporangiales bacterium]